MTTKSSLRIALTVGDPAGVGAEVVLKALYDAEVAALADWVIVGDRGAVEAAARSCGIDTSALPATLLDAKVLPAQERIEFGKLKAAYGAAAAEYVRIATQMCLREEASAMVTAPLNKEAVTLSGMPFSGHTEYIGELCNARESRMLLAGPRLSVIHVSTHIALRKAVELQTERILRTIELGNDAMKLFGHKAPRIAVCGLNPHAGEHGLFGSEDQERIVPAIAAARERGILCDGPCAPDTIFLQASRGSHDLVVAMYHDQGHIPMKLLDFDDTVNVSLGIPIIRTSVDHGTAFDIAGKNKASEQNMKSAMRLAVKMAANRRLTGDSVPVQAGR